MSTEVRLRRGTAAQHNSFVGAPGEITVDTTNNNLRVHDGVTPGGHPLTLQSLFNAHLADTVHIGKNNACYLYHNSAQSVPNDVNYFVTLGFSRFDTANMKDDSKILIKESGIYLIVGNVEFAANPVGYRQANVIKNGTHSLGITTQQPVSSYPSRLNISAIHDLNEGDYVELMVRQNSGGSLNLINANWFSPILSVVRVG